MKRREMLIQTGAGLLALGAVPFPLRWTCAAEDKKKPKILVYTRSQGFEHGSVRRPKGGGLSVAETVVTDLGKKHGIDVVCEKDGRIFLSKDFPSFDGFVFQTQGNLFAERSRDDSPPMQPEGKKALLDAIANGKGFIGCHCASDTFHSPGPRNRNQPTEKIDPYIAMLGGEFIRHGRQQKAWMRLINKEFPGTKGIKDFELHEEWYSLKNFAPDMHVILVQDTKGMQGKDYQRPNFPATWARMHNKGRVFYTSMGHREDVWKNAIFQSLLAGALSWALGNVDAKMPPNLMKVAPNASKLPA